MNINITLPEIPVDYFWGVKWTHNNTIQITIHHYGSGHMMMKMVEVHPVEDPQRNSEMLNEAARTCLTKAIEQEENRKRKEAERD